MVAVNEADVTPSGPHFLRPRTSACPWISFEALFTHAAQVTRLFKSPSVVLLFPPAAAACAPSVSWPYKVPQIRHLPSPDVFLT
jgi:hypothetical protein